MRNMKPEKRIAKNNDGSAIVTVVISMVFVMALGMALLFTAYTGYSIEITQRGDKENFYDATTAMDDMRLGVQTLLSESISTAYTQVLTDYVGTHSSDYDPQVAFNDAITAQLLSKTTSAGVHYFTSTDNGKTISGYKVAAMATFIDANATNATFIYADATTVTFRDATGATVTLAGITANQSAATSDVTIKTISVKYNSSDGFESDITTDITITMPYFFASSSVTSSINNYAIIADNQLIQSTGGPVDITGSVFAGTGGINVSGGGNSLGFTGGDIICKGPISVDNSGVLSFDSPDNQLWTNKIDVGNSGNVTLNGSVFVANDLRLKGKGASATLKETYFGFGDSTSDSEKSSSILVNGRDCALNISGLSKLSLAGISFINTANQSVFDTDNNLYSAAIPMGESLSVKSDQLAYLVPIKCISNFASNPCVFPSTATKAEMTPTVNLNTVLWGTGGNAKTLGNYINGKGTIKTLYKNMDNSWKIVYAFMSFSSKDYANAYFKDYFAADPAKIEQYMNLYLTLSDKADNAKINTAGNTFYVDDNSTAITTDDKLTMNPASDSVYAAGAQLLYNKMQSSYLVFVNTVALSKLPSGTTLEFKNGSNVVAVVSNGGYNYNASSPTTLRLIIASGDVALTNNSTHDGVKGFLGIVISGDNVTVSTDVNGDPLTSDILNSTCTVGTKTYTLSDFINNSAQIEGGSNASEDLWNLDSLVYYQNWLKQ